MISESKKYVFIHIPKTAGTSIREALLQSEHSFVWNWKHWMSHATIKEVKQHLGDEFDQYYKFAFVRNPWDIVLSKYHRRQLKTIQPFEEWIQDPGNKDAHTFRQLNWLRDDNGDVRVDFIGRFETLEYDFETIIKHLNLCKVKLPHLNKGDHIQYNEAPEYTDFAISYVAERAKEDIEYFGYTF